MIQLPARLLAILLAHDMAGIAANAIDRVNFDREIRPLLSDRCFACHGPDDKARKAGLDLRTREAALRGGRSGEPAIRPGDAAHSELFLRIGSTDPDVRMPPPDSKLPPLSPEEIERVRRWIDEGAEFTEHWAFIPVREVTVPDGVAGENPIDAFIRARLASEGLAPNPEADRETLIRRLCLDLTGLPPTLEEIDAFIADTSPDAYERLVDRLLSSPHYGERMAQEWMDLARFADTYGYQADVDRDLSPWRDWVIKAFNENLPWDKFITWQLAGDLLPNPTREQILATAFNRLHRQTNEGGSVEEEFRTEYVADRVHTMGTAFLGLTLECARCHDHKYDPISQRDYYRLFAYFNSIDESGLYSHFTRATPTPVMLLWEPGVEEQHEALVAAIATAETNCVETRREARARFDAWRAAHPEHDIAPRPPIAHFPFEAVRTNTTPDSLSTNLASLHDAPELVPGRVGQALRFSGDNSVVIPHAGDFGRTDPFSFSLWLRPEESQTRAVIFHRSRAWTDSGSRGYECLLDEGRPLFALIHFWPGNAIAVRAHERLNPGRWVHLVITYDGSSRAGGIRLYADGRRLPVEVLRDHLYKDIQHRAEWGDSEVGRIHLTLAGRFRDSGLKNGLIDEFKVYNAELTALEVDRLYRMDAAAGSQPSPALSRDVAIEDAFEYYLARHDPPYQSALAALHAARVAENELINPVREIMVMHELPERRPAFVLRRGAYDAPGEPVDPGVPERIMPLPEGLPPNRLGLARWMTDPSHPLTARVAVNRVWKHHFGHGLVDTTWDFGAQGEVPSHPDLLDWLARHFMDSGWDRKALHKLIVMSATYRQSSHASPELLARDPDNRLLARGPRHRLEAEQIRDGALAASGLLVSTIGGPSVKPHQPPGVWEDAGTGKKYVQDTGAKLYRRSLYTFWRRTAPPPNMITFDATTREVCTAKREITTTPLQALVLLNDPQFLEAARALARDLVEKHPGDPTPRIREAFRRLTGRRPDTRELEILRRLHSEQHALFARDPEAAAKFLGLKDADASGTERVTDWAATTVMASTLINHDEFITKR